MAQLWAWPGIGATDAVKDRAFAALSNLLGRTPVYGQDRIVTASTTVLDDDDLLLVDSTGAAVDVTLPDATKWRGRLLAAKWLAGANTVRLMGTIDGTSNYTIATLKDCITVKSCRTALPATYAWVIV